MTRGGWFKGLLASMFLHVLVAGIVYAAAFLANRPPEFDETPVVLIAADDLDEIDQTPDPDEIIPEEFPQIVEEVEPELPEPVEEEVAEEVVETVPEPEVVEEVPEPLPPEEEEEKEEPAEEPELERVAEVPPPRRKPERERRIRPTEPEPEPLKRDLASSLKDLLKDKLNEEKRRKQQARVTPNVAVRGPKLTETEKTRIRRRMSRCWNFDDGTKYPETLRVVLRIEFRRDGSVVSVVSDDRLREASNVFYRRAVETARTAVLRCAPYTELQPRRYEAWKVMTFAFDPSRGLGF